MREYMRWLYGRCARVLVPSEATRAAADRARRAMRIASTSGAAASTPTLFSPGKRSDAAARANGACRTIGRRVLYVGRLSREKGLDLLPAREAAPARARRRASTRHRRRRSDAARARARCPTPCSPARWPRGRGGGVCVADLFVFPSRTDTAGNVVLEAQAMRPAGARVRAAAGRARTWCTASPGSSARRDADAWADAIAQRCCSDARRRVGVRPATYARRDAGTWRSQPLYRAYREVVHRAAATRAAAPKPAGARGAWRLSAAVAVLTRRWNYKSALLSADLRARCSSSRTARRARCGGGGDDHRVLLPVLAAGFYGALTQAFRRRRAAAPARGGARPAAAVAHALELLVHWCAARRELAASMPPRSRSPGVDAFNLFAMRRGTLIVGEGSQSLLARSRAHAAAAAGRSSSSWRSRQTPPPDQRLPPDVRRHPHVLSRAARGRQPRSIGRCVLVVPGQRTDARDVGRFGRIYS